MNKQIIHDALVLTAFTLVIGVILGAVYGITKTPIDKANEQTKKEAYQAVFADASGFNQQEYDADAADKMVADAGYDDTIDDVEQAVDKDGNALDMSLPLLQKTEVREVLHFPLVSKMMEPSTDIRLPIFPRHRDLV